MKRIVTLLLLLGVGAVAIEFVRACASDEERITASTNAMPPNEKAFVQAVAEFGRSKFIYSSPLEAIQLRRQRAAKICALAAGPAVANWAGRVEEVGATNQGDAILKLYLYGGGTVFLENWNESTNAIEDKLPVAEGSPLFDAVSKLKTNDLVRFDGSFQPHHGDCFRTHGSETADMTGNLAPTMMSTVFIFKWSSVRPLNIRE